MCTLGCVPGRQICFFVVFCRSVSGRYPSSHCAQTDRSKHFAYVSCVLFLPCFLLCFMCAFSALCFLFRASCVVVCRLSSARRVAYGPSCACVRVFLIWAAGAAAGVRPEAAGGTGQPQRRASSSGESKNKKQNKTNKI